MSLPPLRFPRALVGALRNFFRDNCLDQAAVVAYYSLLSAAPFLYLAGLVLRWTLPVSDPAGEALAKASAFAPGELAPFLERLGRSLPAREEMVAVALPALLWIASTAFMAVEKAINVAFGTVPQRGFWLSKLKAFGATSGVTVLLMLSLAANQWTAWLDRYRQRLGLPSALGPRAAWASHLVMWSVAFVAFLTFYKVLPRGRVAWGSAIPAAAFALALWEAARWVFGGLLARSPAFGLTTGTLAGVVAVLLWVYTSVAICLLGAELAASLNGNRP